MKKSLFGVVSAITLMAALTGCTTGTSSVSTSGTSSNGTSETAGNSDSTTSEPTEVKITTCTTSATETKEITVPYKPTRVAILDFAAGDIIDSIGYGSSIVGIADASNVPYLSKYTATEGIYNLGNVKTADMEKVNECDPEIIFIGGRLSASYADFEAIAPTVYLPSTNPGLVESSKANAKIIASIFGMEDEVDSKFSAFDSRISALKTKATGKTALVGMFVGGKYNLLGDTGRCSIISSEIGFTNPYITAASDSGSHGDTTNFEYIKETNPDYIFVMNRDAVTGGSSDTTPEQLFQNELIAEVTAVKDDHVVVLEHSPVWYTGEGGINSLDIMLSDLESTID